MCPRSSRCGERSALPLSYLAEARTGFEPATSHLTGEVSRSCAPGTYDDGPPEIMLAAGCGRLNPHCLGVNQGLQPKYPSPSHREVRRFSCQPTHYHTRVDELAGAPEIKSAAAPVLMRYQIALPDDMAARTGFEPATLSSHEVAEACAPGVNCRKLCGPSRDQGRLRCTTLEGRNRSLRTGREPESPIRWDHTGNSGIRPT